MSDKRTFIDSNVILYLYSDNDRRKELVIALLNSDKTISTQVVNENVNVCIRKIKLSKEEAFGHGKNLLENFNVVNIYSSTITRAFDLSIKYRFSFWHSLIVATALENECEILFSEDMQDGLVVDGTLKIVNPFKDI